MVGFRLLGDGRDLASQHILWEPGFRLLGNVHLFSIDHREGFQACAFMRASFTFNQSPFISERIYKPRSQGRVY